MTVGSGIGGFVGFAPETTYGTYVAPSKFLQVQKADLKKVKTTAQGGGLASGALVLPGARRLVTSKAAAGGLQFDLPNSGMGILLNNLMGGTVTPTIQGAGPAYLQTHALADTTGKSMSIQLGIPDRTGTVRPYSYIGCKVMAAEFSGQIDGLLNASFDIDAQDVDESKAAASPSYVAGQAPFHWGQLAVKLGTFGTEAAVTGVTKVSCKIERPQDTNNFYANGAGLKSEPVTNDFVKVTGSLDVDFANKADFADRFAADSSTSLILSWTGPIIASTYAYTFAINVPMTFFDGDSPTLQGAGVVGTTFPFTGLFDATHAAATITYMSTDVTL